VGGGIPIRRSSVEIISSLFCLLSLRSKFQCLHSDCYARVKNRLFV